MALKIGLNSIFWIGLVLAAVGWLWQYIRLKKPDLPRPVYGKIFSENVIIGFILLVGMAFNN